MKDGLHLDKVIRCIITLEPGVWVIIHTDYFFPRWTASHQDSGELGL